MENIKTINKYNELGFEIEGIMDFNLELVNIELTENDSEATINFYNPNNRTNMYITLTHNTTRISIDGGDEFIPTDEIMVKQCQNLQKLLFNVK